MDKEKNLEEKEIPESAKESIDRLVKEAVEAAKAEAETIVSDAAKKAAEMLAAATEKAAPAKPNKAVINPKDEELVTVRLPFKEQAGDVFVSVNDETCLIQRGKTVQIKRKFYNVLKDGERQDEYAVRLIEEKETESEGRLKEAGM